MCSYRSTRACVSKGQIPRAAAPQQKQLRFLTPIALLVCLLPAVAAQAASTAPVAVTASPTPATAGPLPNTATAAPSATIDSGFTDFGELDLAALLDAQVESASGKSQQISQAPAIIEVITAEQLRALGASTLYEALQRMPGITVMESHWGRKVVNIRGFQAALFNEKVLFLLDGHTLSLKSATWARSWNRCHSVRSRA